MTNSSNPLYVQQENAVISMHNNYFPLTIKKLYASRNKMGASGKVITLDIKLVH